MKENRVIEEAHREASLDKKRKGKRNKTIVIKKPPPRTRETGSSESAQRPKQKKKFLQFMSSSVQLAITCHIRRETGKPTKATRL